MSKRGPSDDHDRQTKKRRVRQEEALSPILTHADDLANYLTVLQTNRRHSGQYGACTEDVIRDAQDKIGPLVLKLLPSFQAVAAIEKEKTESSGLPDVEVSKAEMQLTSSRQEIEERGLAIPTIHAVRPWSLPDIPEELPPIPKIHKADLEEAVFKHAGTDSKINYERLEWLGDAYLEIIASNLVFQTFGSLTPGRCSQMREQLVRNVTLAEYFRMYRLDSRAKIPSELGPLFKDASARVKQRELIKVHADMFEAYVAAAIISDPEDGLGKTTDWLKKLWGRTLKPQLEKGEREGLVSMPAELQLSSKDNTVVDIPPKVRLQQVLGGKGIALRYEDMPTKKKDQHMNLRLYSMGVYLDGWGAQNKLLGTGTAMSKTDAGQKAAVAALQSKKLLSPYINKRKAFLEARDADKESEV